MDAPRVRREVVVALPPERAFAVFTALATWWPAEYTWSGPDALASVGIDPGAGGLCYEIGPHGFRCDWGRVLEWEPPHRLVLAWQIGPDRVPQPDPDRASTVTVAFTPTGDGTTVAVEHTGFERHGDGADGYRDGMTQGWADLLARYADAAI